MSNRTLSNEDRVKWLSRRELGAIYWRCCFDRTIGETAILLKLNPKTIQSYTTKAYKKLGLENVPKEDKAVLAKRDFCPIIRELITAPKMIDEWVSIDPYTHKEIVLIDTDEEEEEPEEPETIIIEPPIKRPPPLLPSGRPRLTCMTMSIYALIIVLTCTLGTVIGRWLFPRIITQIARVTSVVTSVVTEQVPVTVIATQVASIIQTDTPEPTLEPTNTPEPTETPSPLGLKLGD